MRFYWKLFKNGTLSLVILFSISMCAQKNDNYSIPKLLERYNKESVKYITVDSLQNSINDFVILDTRKLKEYEVSHLPGAIWVGEDYNPKAFPQIGKDQKIVVYCSVGIRSEGYGEELLKSGYSQVYNLYGSIFLWKDAGYKVFDTSEKPTDSVHVYSRRWGNYLKSGKKVY